MEQEQKVCNRTLGHEMTNRSQEQKISKKMEKMMMLGTVLELQS